MRPGPDKRDYPERLRRADVDSALRPLMLESAAEIERLRAVIRQAVDAYDSGNLQLSSPELGEPENDIPMHPWHEEWLHYARQALA